VLTTHPETHDLEICEDGTSDTRLPKKTDTRLRREAGHRCTGYPL